ncbi:hypothetical protein DM870_26255, partial [Escherichia coli]
MSVCILRVRVRIFACACGRPERACAALGYGKHDDRGSFGSRDTSISIFIDRRRVLIYGDTVI